MILGDPVNHALNLLIVLRHCLDKDFLDLASGILNNFLKHYLGSITKQDRLSWHDSKEAFLDFGGEIVPFDVDRAGHLELVGSLGAVVWEDGLFDFPLSDGIVVCNLDLNWVKHSECPGCGRVEFLPGIELELLVGSQVFVTGPGYADLGTEFVDH